MSGLITPRYLLHEKLGAGGMGMVYRATDRLNRRNVALKRLIFPPDLLELLSEESRGELILSLAHEFEMLSSLRHPYIISVLDYGFDTKKQPYLVMEMLEESRTILEVGWSQPLTVQIDLLMQTLQALVYLHRRGVIHCDLKPDNILVIRDKESGNYQVKVLDFGLSILKDRIDQTSTDTQGTLAYMAPEVISDGKSTEAADLYAVGVIGYQMFAGHLPFWHGQVQTMARMILNAAPDMTELDVPTPLIRVVERLLSKPPDMRYATVEETLDALSQATGQKPKETIAIRESFLQAAEFVGREQELSHLTAALTAAREGTGSVWLIGGESGVGKTRLIEELRTQALVQGVLVVRGQGVASGGLPYQLWREPMRRLILSTELNDLQAAILKEIIPDIGLLLAREIPDAPQLDAQSAQQRLVLTIAEILHRQQQPVLLNLEDLQWAIESLEPLRQLIQVAPDLPLLVVGSFRSDESPHLPGQLPGVELITLPRLSDDEIMTLSASMLGETGKQPSILSFLHKEAEGNVFFLVEVVRALAEEAGRLTAIDGTLLPERIFTGGIQQIVRRRLNKLPESAYPLLELAAVGERQLDLAVLKKVSGKTNLESWLTICANVAVLQIKTEQWQFSYDKLRETVLADLDTRERSTLHRQTAEAIEAIYQDDISYANILREHWHAAGNEEKERHYARLAGEQALVVSSFEEAVTNFERASTLLPAQDQTDKMELLKLLGDAYFNLSDYTTANAYYEQSLSIARHLDSQAGRIAAHEGLGRMANDLGDYEVARRHHEKSLALVEAINDRSGIARHMIYMGDLSVAQGEYTEAISYFEKSLSIAQVVDDQTTEARSLLKLGGAMTVLGEYTKARGYYERSLVIVRKLGNRYGIAASLNNLGTVAIGQGDYPAAEAYLEQSLTLLREIGNRLAVAAVFVNLGEIAIIQDDNEKACDYWEQSIAISREIDNRFLLTHGLSDIAIAYIRLDKSTLARRVLREALQLARDISVPVTLKALVGFAWLYLQQNQAERSAELLYFLLDHPTLDPNMQHTHLDPLMKELESVLSSAALEAAAARSKQLKLDALVTELITG